MIPLTRPIKLALLVIGIIGVAALTFYSFSYYKTPDSKTAEEPQIEIPEETYIWKPVAILPDIAAISVDRGGEKGVAVSGEGYIAITRDGGYSWQAEGSTPIGDGEIIGGVYMRGNRVLIGTGVDASRYTGLYQYELSRDKWEKESKEWGGITGVSKDGDLFVGGNGVLVRQQGSKWEGNQLPPCGQVTLYAVDKEARTAVAVGDMGVVARSTDGGESWLCSSLKKSTPINNTPTNTSTQKPEEQKPEEQKMAEEPALYAVAISGKHGLIGGAKGSLWRWERGEWVEVKSLNINGTIFAIHLEKNGQGFIAGGSDHGTDPFIYHTIDGGKNWQSEQISDATGRVIGLARGKAGLIAATTDGRILVRSIKDERNSK